MENNVHAIRGDLSEYTFRDEDLTDLYGKYTLRFISKCIVCGSSVHDDWGGGASKCSSCGFVWMKEQLGEIGLNEYYKNYIDRRRINNDVKMAQRAEQYALDVALIKRFVSEGKIVDVGCNGGFFLDAMGNSFERYGTEVDESAVEFCRSKFVDFGCNILHGSLDKASMSAESFDLVVMRGVIEHVPSPVEVLDEVARILKPGGYLYICATPNVESFAAELYRQDWSLFHPVQHLWHFSARSIASLCLRYEMELVWEEYPYIGTPYENARRDVVLVADRLAGKFGEISPPFWGSMMSLVLRKAR